MKYSCLIVEDEVLMRNNLCKKVRNYSDLFTLMGEAKNGAHALEMIEEKKIIPNLVITDIEMPVMNGLELAEALSINYPQTRIVIISGYNNFSYAQQAIKYNVCDYLLKPVTDETLYETLLGIKMKLDSTYHIETNEVKLINDSTSPKDVVNRIQNYIRLHYTEEIALDTLAEQFQFSPSYLRKIFKQYTQCTPSQYLTHLRISEAKRLLLTSDQFSISTIGNMVGYQDHFYFSRVFKKCTGMYPSEYKNIEL